jgi:hypothetical protein
MARNPPPNRIEIARLEESTRISGGGIFCVVMLVLGAAMTLKAPK